MKTQKIKGLEIEVPNTSAFNIETPPGLPKMHFCMVASAKRGSGKTVAIVNLIKQLQDAKVLDRVFLISPTIKSNKAILDMIKIDEADIFEEPTRESLDAVIDAVKQEAEDYDEYLRLLKIYKKYLKYINSGRGTLSDEDIFDIYDTENQTIAPPKHKYNGKKPVMLCFFDDIQGGNIFSTKSKIHNVTIKHRHLGQLKEGGALGLSMIFATQTYKSNAYGLPRTVRAQATHILLFKTKDASELDEISSEFSGEIPKETFMQVYEYATEEPHSFLFIDLHPKPTDPSIFRKRFDTYIFPAALPPPQAEKEVSDKK